MRPRLKTLQPRVQTLSTATQATAPARGNSTQRGYNYRWQRYREHWLALHPLCGDRANGPSAEHSKCRRVGRTTAATDVDHIQRVNGAQDPLFWDPLNHQSLCHTCHSVKTQVEMGGTARRRQDIGPDGWPLD